MTPLKKALLALTAIYLAIFSFYAFTHQQSVNPSLGEGSTINNYYGIPTNASSTIGTTSALISATSTARTYYMVTNKTGGTLTVSVGVPAVTNKGVVLADGASWTMNTSKIFTAAIYGISTATGSVSILEAK
jgi:hypothetical protein